MSRGDDLLFDGKAFRATGAVVGFQNLKHILLIVRPGHCLTAAINRHRAGVLELPNQANGVVFMVVQSNELGHALQHFGTERIDIALPCFCQYTERISVNALTVFPITSPRFRRATRKVVVRFVLIIEIHGRGRIEQCCQQILLHVSHWGSVLCQTA